jgi:hypothetical protein
MNEANIDVVLDPDATKDGEQSMQRVTAAAAAVEDRLPTTRLPPIAPPPLRPPSIPPGVLAPPGIASTRNSPTLPPVGRPLDPTAKFPTDTVRPPKPSWFRALLTTTSPPPAAEPLDSGAVRRTVAVGCVAAACAFAVIALVFAFRSPPALGTMPPVVAATVVLAHAFLAIGAGSFSYGLLRVAERLWGTKAGPDFGAGGFPG